MDKVCTGFLKNEKHSFAFCFRPRCAKKQNKIKIDKKRYLVIQVCAPAYCVLSLAQLNCFYIREICPLCVCVVGCFFFECVCVCERDREVGGGMWDLMKCLAFGVVSFPVVSGFFPVPN